MIDCEWPSSSTSSFPKKKSVLFSFLSFIKTEVKGFESEVKYSHSAVVWSDQNRNYVLGK